MHLYLQVYIYNLQMKINYFLVKVVVKMYTMYKTVEEKSHLF